MSPIITTPKQNTHTGTQVSLVYRSHPCPLHPSAPQESLTTAPSGIGLGGTTLFASPPSSAATSSAHTAGYAASSPSTPATSGNLHTGTSQLPDSGPQPGPTAQGEQLQQEKGQGEQGKGQRQGQPMPSRGHHWGQALQYLAHVAAVSPQHTPSVSLAITREAAGYGRLSARLVSGAAAARGAGKGGGVQAAAGGERTAGEPPEQSGMQQQQPQQQEDEREDSRQQQQQEQQAASGGALLLVPVLKSAWKVGSQWGRMTHSAAAFFGGHLSCPFVCIGLMLGCIDLGCLSTWMVEMERL